MQTYNGIIGLNIVKVTTDDVIGLKSKNLGDMYFEKFLPKYILTEKDTISSTIYHLHFVDEHSDKKEWICFDIDFTDDLTKEEISNIGANDFFEKAIPLLKEQIPINFSEYRRSLGNTKYLLVEITYKTIQYYDYDDYDMDYYFLKFLDFEKIKE